MVTQYVLKDSNLLGDALAIVIVPLSVLGFCACYLGQGQYQKARNDLIAMLRISTFPWHPLDGTARAQPQARKPRSNGGQSPFLSHRRHEFHGAGYTYGHGRM